MPIVNVILVLVVVGFALWAINTYVPMAKPIKAILNLIIVVGLCVWLLQTFGVIGPIRGIRVR